MNRTNPSVPEPGPVAVPTLDELIEHPERAATLPRHVAAALYPGAARVEAALRARMLSLAAEPAVAPAQPAPAEPASEGPEWLTADEAVALGVPRRWLTDKARWLAREGVVVRLGHKTIRYNRAKLRALLEREARTAQVHAQGGRP